VRLVDHEASTFQQAKMTRNGRPADRQSICNLTDGAPTRDEELDYGAPVGITQRVEGITSKFNRVHDTMVTNELPYAGPEAVWSILTDGSGYSNWDSGVERVEGRIAPGETIKVFSKVNPGRAFPVKMTEFEPGRRMVWSGGMPLGLFKGVRTLRLSRQASGTTKFDVREEYSGPLLSVMWRTIPDLDPSFRQFASGLKTAAETSH
jgi:hypothetical protein